MALPMDDDSIRCWCKLYEEHGLATATARQEAELAERARAKAPASRAERAQACGHFHTGMRPGAGVLTSQ